MVTCPRKSCTSIPCNVRTMRRLSKSTSRSFCMPYLMFRRRKLATRSSLITAARRLARPTHVPQPFPAAAVVREVEHEVDVRVHLRHDEVVAVEQLREPRGGYVSGDRPVERGHAGGWNGINSPVASSLASSSDGGISPGSAHDAFTAVRITTCGDVKWFRTNP